MDSFRTTIDTCPRCGGTHPNVKALPVPGVVPVLVLPGFPAPEPMPFYATCPATGAPVLLRVAAPPQPQQQPKGEGG